MKVYLGIDLGSTTSKAVYMDDRGKIIGRGITNTRADYEVAAEIARMEGEFNSRFTLLRRKVEASEADHGNWKEVFSGLEGRFRYLQFRERFQRLMDVMRRKAGDMPDGPVRRNILSHLDRVEPLIEDNAKKKLFAEGGGTRMEFFRDLFGEGYLKHIEDLPKDLFDQLTALYDRSIVGVENMVIDFDFAELTDRALGILPETMDESWSVVAGFLEDAATVSLEPADYIGTGYGRQLLPFDQTHIKSEILCHALGAHACFPRTRTVLDIGGQDTKAIQVDRHGFVTSFQMNDRCAAGCGRYLGYIADEMSMSVTELGPMALDAEYESNICSTCTVFAGAELREYLNLGEKQENILAGLHKAIVQRAFSLLARSGGVRDEFTFTGGVARNDAVVKYVNQMVQDNYGDVTINVHPDSIFMGALGAAIFSSRRQDEGRHPSRHAELDEA